MPTFSARLAALRQLSIARRIRIAYLLFLLPLVYLASILAHQFLDEIALLEREVAGSRFISALGALQDAAERDRSAGRTSGSATLAHDVARLKREHGIDPSNGPRALSGVSELPPKDAARHRVVLDLIAAAVDSSGLSLDTRLDTYYLANALFVQLPRLVDELGAAASLARPEYSDPAQSWHLGRQGSRIATLAERTELALERAGRAASESKSTEALAVNVRLGHVRHVDEILEGLNPSPLIAADLDAALAAAFGEIELLRKSGAATLELLLSQRLNSRWHALLSHVAITGLLFGLGAIFLFIAVERGTLRPIVTITALLRQLTIGGSDPAAPTPRRSSEIAAMFDALAKLRDNTKQRAAEERALRVRQEALLRITQDHLLKRSSRKDTLDAIAQTACEILDADRVLINASAVDKQVVISRYEKAFPPSQRDAKHPGQTTSNEFIQLTKLFPCLDAQMVVKFDDVATDTQTPFEIRKWLMELGVGSLVLARIGIPGQESGYLTIATRGRLRVWDETDIAFARALADLAAFSFLDHSHRQAMTGLDLVDEGLHVSDPSGTIVYANRMSRKLAGAESGAILVAGSLPGLPTEPGDADGEISWRAPDGATFELDIARRVMPDRNVVTLVRDVTVRKRQERERLALEAELRQAAKMEAIGRLSGGIAHDFNNVLGTIIGYGSFLVADLPQDGPDWEYARRLMRAADHGKDLVRRILTYAREEKTERRVADLRSVLTEISTLTRASLPSSTRIDLDIMSDPAPVLVNESEIFQVVLNLCINANDALADAPGRIAISLKSARPDEDGAEWAARATGGTLSADHSYVRLTVADTGSGMTQEVLDRVFEPFYTTKERGRGTGLGLAVVDGIIAAHNGAYRVESGPGRGTRFSIYLPLTSQGADKGVDGPILSDPRGRETVLVVDDDNDLLEMMIAGLERFGYQVIGTDSARDALDALTTDPDVWDIVVTDHVMPEMKGATLATEIKRVRPDCPVILCTGFSDNLTEARAQSLGADVFLLKPIEPAEIARHIRGLVGS